MLHAMNYRHAFHAGNHADVLKHIVLLALVDALKRKDTPFFVLDTHAGRGRYLLGGAESRKTSEADEGVFRLLDAPRLPALAEAYLRAVQATGTDEASKVMAHMKATPIKDFFGKNGRIREDGRMVHDMYLAQVKTPAESKYPWDYYKLVATVPGDKAFLPLAQSKCPMVNKK